MGMGQVRASEGLGLGAQRSKLGQAAWGQVAGTEPSAVSRPLS